MRLDEYDRRPCVPEDGRAIQAGLKQRQGWIIVLRLDIASNRHRIATLAKSARCISCRFTGKHSCLRKGALENDVEADCSAWKKQAESTALRDVTFVSIR